MTLTDQAIEAMTVEERLSLIERVWDTLDAAPECIDIPLADERREELDRRLDQMEREGPDAGILWENLVARVKSGKA